MAKMLVIDSVRKCLFRATGGVCSHPDAPEIDPGPGDDADICWDYPDRTEEADDER